MSTAVLSRMRGVVAFEATIVVIGALAVVAALDYGLFTNEGQVGPGFLPLVAGAVMALAAGYDAIRKAQAPAIEAAPSAEHDVDIYGRDSAHRRRQLWMVIGLVAAAVLLVGVVGFLVAFGLLVVACAALVERRRLVPALVTAGLVVAGVWLVFVVGLGIPLPTGLLGVR